MTNLHPVVICSIQQDFTSFSYFYM